MATQEKLKAEERRLRFAIKIDSLETAGRAGVWDMKTVIIGAGLTGLILGHLLSKSSTVTLIEKSRGVGGRMATRRTEAARFDHGAQFYAQRDPLQPYHERWISSALTRFWFERKNAKHFNAPSGLTTLAKDLAKDLEIHFETRLETASATGSGWRLKMKSSEELLCDRLILTAPLPQCLEILRSSEICYDTALDQIEYSKALVALIELEIESQTLGGESGYREFDQGSVYSISDQMRKGVSENPALTVTLSAEISTRMYEAHDAAIIEIVRGELLRLDPGAVVKSMQIKRWKYNRPLTTYGALCCEVTPSLFLAGDAFGGASLNGAARSANGLAERLTV